MVNTFRPLHEVLGELVQKAAQRSGVVRLSRRLAKQILIRLRPTVPAGGSSLWLVRQDNEGLSGCGLTTAVVSAVTADDAIAALVCYAEDNEPLAVNYERCTAYLLAEQHRTVPLAGAGGIVSLTAITAQI